MTPFDLLAELRTAGAHVTFDATGLRVGPTRLLTPERRAAIKFHRDDLIALLVREHDAEAMPQVDDRIVTDGAEPEPTSVDVVPQQEGWDMPAVIAYLQALPQSELEIFRAAIEFDAAALRSVDAARRAG